MSVINFTYRIAADEALPPIARPAYFVNKDERWLRVEVVAAKTIHGLESENVFLREEEVFSIGEGDFLDQHPEPIGHNPSEDYTEYSKAFDRIFCCIDKSKRCSNGVIRWDIPLEIYDPALLNRIKVTVTQEYRLQNRELTISKGGSILIKNLPID